ncbi:hypothetical protein ABFT80_23970 [Mesorhizobium sp. SB112]|uniref:hypothetical protein n=1 Tax=Mesorhizobium sp. SB112 TaxID=3151853 RepID=UPI0032648008
MKLADDITITVAGEEIFLHPALRHAIRLERLEGSFAKLIRDVQENSLSAAVEIIRDHTDMLFLENRVLEVLPELKGSLLAYVMALTGIDLEDAPAKAKTNGSKSVPFADHLTNLYRIGTGWLGWTPETTLDATPTEITQAYKGRLEMLKAIFGGGEKAKPEDDRPLNEKFRSLFAAHGTVKEAA